MEFAALAVAVVSAFIAGLALWRNWRWSPREARLDLTAPTFVLYSGTTPEHVATSVTNVGDVPARDVRYKLEGCEWSSSSDEPRNAAIEPGKNGSGLGLHRLQDTWEGAFVIVTYNRYPVHLAGRLSIKLSIQDALNDQPHRGKPNVGVW